MALNFQVVSTCKQRETATVPDKTPFARSRTMTDESLPIE